MTVTKEAKIEAAKRIAVKLGEIITICQCYDLRELEEVFFEIRQGIREEIDERENETKK